ncbi:MAG: GtrA family protein [Clostridia bacterium]
MEDNKQKSTDTKAENGLIDDFTKDDLENPSNASDITVEPNNITAESVTDLGNTTSKTSETSNLTTENVADLNNATSKTTETNNNVENPKNLKKENIIQAVKFTLFSASAGLIQLAVSALCVKAIHLPEWLGYIIALVCSVLWNFTFNRKFTFKSASNVPKSMLLAFLFYVPFAPFSTFFVKWLSGLMPEIVPTIIAMLINFVLEFLWQKFVVFKKPKA